MKYIKNDKYVKIKELADNGDQKAKDFLFNFMQMSDEEANQYLSEIATDNETSDYAKVIQDLIADENEAIDGYDKAIKYLANIDKENKEEIIKKLEEIKADEMQHIEDLKRVL